MTLAAFKCAQITALQLHFAGPANVNTVNCRLVGSVGPGHPQHKKPKHPVGRDLLQEFPGAMGHDYQIKLGRRPVTLKMIEQ